MPGPFPGMDPYIEDPILWPGMHDALIVHIRETLNIVLPENYAAGSGERLFVVQPERNIYPDVAVFRRPIPTPVTEGRGAAMAVEDAPTIIELAPIEIHESYVEVISLRPTERIVTIVEILSHANKAATGQGRGLYLNKQSEVLESDTHLVEIDLLRAGLHTVAAPKDYLEAKVGVWDYLVCLHRAGRRWRYECWPNRMRSSLPSIRIPLSGDDPDIELDLQAMVDVCYDGGRYTHRIDYSSEPTPMLRKDDAEWVDELLRGSGVRP